MTVHIVQKGDTLWKIAKQHQIPFDEIKRLNAHLANPDYIVPGMEIFLPDIQNAPKSNKEIPIEPQVIQMPMPQQPPKKEMPMKETPRPTVPISPPQIAPTAPPPSWLPFPQPVPFPMPYPQQMQPIVMPQQPTAPQTIRIEQPQMPMPIPIQMPQQPAPPMPMQCPSCRMTVMIAMPQEQPKEEQKPARTEQAPVAEKNTRPAPCSPAQMPAMEHAPWMMPPTIPMPWGGSHCRSCQQPMHAHPMWHWPIPQPTMWPQTSPMSMNESASFPMPEAMTQQWQHPDSKCEMQQHIVNQYYDEIREIEQSNRPCHPQLTPPMHMPYFQQ